MYAHVAVTFLEPVVLANVVKIIPADNDGALHLHLLNDAGEDASSDGHIAGEWTLLVDVGSLQSLNKKKILLQSLMKVQYY